jgi:hypothetical protein
VPQVVEAHVPRDGAGVELEAAARARAGPGFPLAERTR